MANDLVYGGGQCKIPVAVSFMLLFFYATFNAIVLLFLFTMLVRMGFALDLALLLSSFAPPFVFLAALPSSIQICYLYTGFE